MNVFILKIIALTTMIIDHYGAIFQGDTMFFRMIGRLAFPIYCFLLVEGYFHTSDVKKYAKRLFIFALISEVPFDLAFYNKLGFVHQNIFFTLFIGLAAIYILDNREGKYNFNKNTVVLIKTAVILISCVLATLLSVDYSAIGIIYILVFYFTRNYDKFKRFITIVPIMLIVNFSASIFQQFSLLALPLLYSYNGELGPKNKILQISFYVAYPLHLMIFYIIKISFPLL
jgi:hypothetical protein